MSKRLTRSLAAVLGVGALAVGGAAIANATSSQGTAASATTTATTPSSSGSGSSGGSALPALNMPAPGTAAHEDAEKQVTGSAAAKAQAAAVEETGGGTAGAVTTDYPGTGYEVTVTKSDGSKVEVHLDSSFTAFQGGPGGPPHAGR